MNRTLGKATAFLILAASIAAGIGINLLLGSPRIARASETARAIADTSCALQDYQRRGRLAYLDNEARELSDKIAKEGLALAKLNGELNRIVGGRQSRKNIWKFLKPVLTVGTVAVGGVGVYRVFFLNRTVYGIPSLLLSKAYVVTSNSLELLALTGVLAFPSDVLAASTRVHEEPVRLEDLARQSRLNPGLSSAGLNLLASTDCSRGRCSASREDITAAWQQLIKSTVDMTRQLRREVEDQTPWYKVSNFRERKLREIEIPVGQIKMNLLAAQLGHIQYLGEILKNDARACAAR